MQDIILDDLCQGESGARLFTLKKNKFDPFASYAGLFLTEADTAILNAAVKYNNHPKHGFYVPIWKSYGTLSLRDFIACLDVQRPQDVIATGYDNTGASEFLLVERPDVPIVMHTKDAYIPLSWKQKQEIPDFTYIMEVPQRFPTVFRQVELRFYMNNNRLMSLDRYRIEVVKEMFSRMQQLVREYPAYTAAVHYYLAVEHKTPSQLPMDVIEKVCGQSGDFNPHVVRLYAAYHIMLSSVFEIAKDGAPHLKQRHAE